MADLSPLCVTTRTSAGGAMRPTVTHGRPLSLYFEAFAILCSKWPPWPASGAAQALSAYTDAACILARPRSNVIRHVMQTVGAASTPTSACVSRRQRSLVPLPWDRRALDYFENEKRFPGAHDRSNDQPLPATSNCARGLKWRVVCITFRYCGSPVLSCSCAASCSGGICKDADSV
jgi:hypothetical protein